MDEDLISPFTLLESDCEHPSDKGKMTFKQSKKARRILKNRSISYIYLHQSTEYPKLNSEFCKMPKNTHAKVLLYDNVVTGKDYLVLDDKAPCMDGKKGSSTN